MSNKNILICVIGVILLLALVADFFLGRKREAIIITTYASVAEISLNELIAKADVIAIGEFINIQPSRWSTSNGKLPANATVDYVSEHQLRIFNDSPFHISAYLKGNNQDPVVRVRTFGGQVEADIMIVSSEPEYKVKQTYLLFLYYNTGTTADIDPGAYYGSHIYYEVDDGQAVSTRDTWLLEDLITHIEKSLSGEVPVLPAETLLPIATNVSTETAMPPTETPLPAETQTSTP